MQHSTGIASGTSGIERCVIQARALERYRPAHVRMPRAGPRGPPVPPYGHVGKLKTRRPTVTHTYVRTYVSEARRDGSLR